MAKLDIVVLQCGFPELTVRLLDSIHDTSSDVRVILIDNGSPRKDLFRVIPALKRGRHALFINKTNLGFAKAVNQGLRTSTSPYVCIQNNDTIMYPHGYERLLAHLEDDPGLGCIGPLTNSANTEQRVPGPDAVSEGRFYTNGLVAFFCTVLPRHVIRNVGLLSEDYGLGYGEDDDYCIRLRRAGYRLGIARDVYVHHDHHTTYRYLFGDDGIRKMGEQGLSMLREKYGEVV